MNDEQIIRMVNEAGWDAVNLEDGFGIRIKRFAELVAKAEREACAKVCDEQAWRCKKIAVETQNKQANAAAIEAHICAAAIRARGEQK